MQTFVSSNSSFIFCDYNWQTELDSSGNSSANYIINFQSRNDVYVWECGYNSQDFILLSYLKYGEQFIDNVRPDDSSFIVYDANTDIIIAVRDFMGNFPVYYYESPGETRQRIFSFSMKALAVSGKVNRGINYAKIVEYIGANVFELPNNHTFYRDIYRLLPGYITLIGQGDTKVLKRYGKFDIVKYKSFTDEEYITTFRDLFVKSVKKSTTHSEKIAASLSGGLDSSSVCCVAQSLQKKPIYTFNFKPETEEAQEDNYIKAVVGKCGNIHRTIQSDLSSYDAIKAIIEQTGQPLFVINHTIQLELIKSAKENNCDVLLSGHWGDQVVDYGLLYPEELFIKKDWPALKKAISQLFSNSIYTNNNVSCEKKKVSMERAYTIKLFLKGAKEERVWRRMPKLIWILMRYFDCSILDFLKLLIDKLNVKSKQPRPNADRLINADILSERERILNKYPFEELVIADTTNASQRFFQKRQLKAIFKGNQTYGQEEYFELYRQNNMRTFHPFFDRELLELCLSIPLRIKFDNGRKRGTVRKALINYLPEEISNRTTKAVFTTHYAALFKDLWNDFEKQTPLNHPIWKIVNRATVMENISLLYKGEYAAMPPLVRIINLAIWLDYLQKQEKSGAAINGGAN
ncbi:asparagine synthase-related protein [Spirosoma sp. SC4-14]|uniref:asparagine synthase-related protein n=1 Tax=Spirosoma sp. SC4-14 TaxID=3128900 RepID=UPI0030D1421A